MPSQNPPDVVKILQEQGEINDELDYAIMSYLIKNRGTGYTACQPQLVELEGNKKAIERDPMLIAASISRPVSPITTM
ncbi:unnamed protein product [marine sediment metagenome]|uniref:Uncharacterized protein n=1 Tax=marine sediment metagenome TaxID=412755 RepID=X1U336_9ZZZZ